MVPLLYTFFSLAAFSSFCRIHFGKRKLYNKETLLKQIHQIWFFCFKLSKILTIATIRKNASDFLVSYFEYHQIWLNILMNITTWAKMVFVVIATSHTWGKKTKLFWMKVWPKINAIVYNMKRCLRFSTFIFWVSPIFNKLYRYLKVKYVIKGV